MALAMETSCTAPTTTTAMSRTDRLSDVLHSSKRIVVVAGAGISTSAGLPDFRSSDGLFQRLKTQHKIKGSGQNLFDVSLYSNDNLTSCFHDMIAELSRQARSAKPTEFHHMLAKIADEGRLLRLYTQNIDGLEGALEPLTTRTPYGKDHNGKWAKTVQVHGSLDYMVCTMCAMLTKLEPDTISGPEAPLCKSCEAVDNVRRFEGKRSRGVGRLRPRITLYGERSPDEDEITKAAGSDVRQRPDAIIVVGTTLKVPGMQTITRNICRAVRQQKQGVTVWISTEPPPAGFRAQDSWDIVVRDTADSVARYVALGHWISLTHTPGPQGT
nr:hypothetical protein B0A51_00069 [Rachicladosporium sp. CCFEE 5018]